MAIHEIMTKPSSISSTFVQPTNAVKNNVSPSSWNISFKNKGCIISGILILLIILLLFLLDEESSTNNLNVKLPSNNYKIHYF